MKIEVKERYQGVYEPIIHHGGILRISYRSETGKFNFLGNEESTMCHIHIYEDGKRLKGKSVDVNLGDEYEGDDVDEAVYLIDEDERMHWIDTAREEKQAIKNFILANREAIEYGNALHEIEKLTKEIAGKSERLEYLTRNLATV